MVAVGLCVLQKRWRANSGSCCGGSGTVSRHNAVGSQLPKKWVLA